MNSIRSHPATKQLLDITAVVVFLTGLPTSSLCCHFNEAVKPHRLSFVSALCGSESRRFEIYGRPVSLDKLSS